MTPRLETWTRNQLLRLAHRIGLHEPQRRATADLRRSLRHHWGRTA